MSGQILSQKTRDLLIILREGNSCLAAMADKFDAAWDPALTDLRRLHNSYARNLISCYVSKFTDLSVALLSAVETSNYLAYALCGRALLETTATLRYYVVHQYDQLFGKRELTDDDLHRLIEIDDQHLRGSRFDWESFMFQRYTKMKVDTERKLRNKGKKGAGSPDSEKEAVRPAGIGQCVDKWAMESPGIRITYDLFCDLVHPNIGSNFLVASVCENKLYFKKRDGALVGQQILEQSLPILMSAAHKPFGEYLLRLRASIWHEDELR